MLGRCRFFWTLFGCGRTYVIIDQRRARWREYGSRYAFMWPAMALYYVKTLEFDCKIVRTLLFNVLIGHYNFTQRYIVIISLRMYNTQCRNLSISQIGLSTSKPTLKNMSTKKFSCVSLTI